MLSSRIHSFDMIIIRYEIFPATATNNAVIHYKLILKLTNDRYTGRKQISSANISSEKAE